MPGSEHQPSGSLEDMWRPDEPGAEPAEQARKPSPFSDIDLARWREYDDIITDSLWLLGARDSTSVHSGDYWGNFVPQIPPQALRRFTRAGETVLDAFLGLGTTLIECKRLGRNGVGVELVPWVAARAEELVGQAPNSQDIATNTRRR